MSSQRVPTRDLQIAKLERVAKIHPIAAKRRAYRTRLAALKEAAVGENRGRSKS